MKRFDIVLFGASGFTGKFVARQLAKIYKNENISWAIAGRSPYKLAQVKEDLQSRHDDLPPIESIVVDVNDRDAIKRMCDKAKLIINCVGPYRFYGEQVVNECLKSGTHHIDVSGEPEFLEHTYLNAHKKALESNIYIIGSCGFDSVPADIGFLYTKSQFPGHLNHVENYLCVETNGDPLNMNYATWESAVYGIAAAKNLGRLRKQLFKAPPPPSLYKPAKKLNRLGYFYHQDLQKYAMPFFGSDKSVVQRTEYSNYVLFDKRPVQYYAYFTLDKLNYCYKFLFWGFIVNLLAKFSFGRNLLLKHYNFFTRGLAVKKDSVEEELSKVRFKMKFYGHGWDENTANSGVLVDKKPNKSIITQVTTPENGYLTTAIIVSNCAVVLLRESDKIQVKGGVLTPAMAFSNTSLIQRLQDNGILFENLTKFNNIQQQQRHDQFNLN